MSQSPNATRTPNLRDDSKIPWDKQNSTFYWRMYINQAHRYSPTIETMDGYSKKVGQDEAKDKHQLLNTKINTIFGVHGWLKKCDKIEIFHRRGTFIDKHHDPLVVILMPHTYQLQSEYISSKYVQLHQFLDSFYKVAKDGGDFATLIRKGRATWSKDDYLNVNLIGAFASPDKLDEYCTRLVRNSHNFHRVMLFREEYLKKFPHLNISLNR